MLCCVVSRLASHTPHVGAKLELGKYDVVVAVSGDGLLNELVNGLLSRPDWDAARRQTIGAIPFGTGNALAYALGCWPPIKAVMAIVQGMVRPLDICSSWQLAPPSAPPPPASPPVRRRFFFLNIATGIIGDIGSCRRWTEWQDLAPLIPIFAVSLDINSEKYRWMGNLRNTVGGIEALASAITYNGSVHYLPEPVTAPSAADPYVRGRVLSFFLRPFSASRAALQLIDHAIDGQIDAYEQESFCLLTTSHLYRLRESALRISLLNKCSFTCRSCCLICPPFVFSC